MDKKAERVIALAVSNHRQTFEVAQEMLTALTDRMERDGYAVTASLLRQFRLEGVDIWRPGFKGQMVWFRLINYQATDFARMLMEEEDHVLVIHKYFGRIADLHFNLEPPQIRQ